MELMLKMEDAKYVSVLDTPSFLSSSAVKKNILVNRPAGRKTLIKFLLRNRAIAVTRPIFRSMALKLYTYIKP